MKTSEVLKHAKRYLAKSYDETCDHSDKEKFICIAINTASAHSKRITNGDIDRCKDIIHSRIGSEYTLEGWLESNGCINSYSLGNRATKDHIQQHRHAWLDLLIAEFETKGE